MAFERRPIDEDSNAMVREQAAQWNAYNGQWAIDLQTSDCLFFNGRDVLEPRIPSEFVMLTAARKERWKLEIIASYHIPAPYLATLVAPDTQKPDYLAVLKLNSAHPPRTKAPQDLAREALAVLEGKPKLSLLFAPDWRKLDAVRTEIYLAEAEEKRKVWDHKPSPWLEIKQKLREIFFRQR